MQSHAHTQTLPMTLEEWTPIATPRTELLHGFEYDLRAQATTVHHAQMCSKITTLFSNQLNQSESLCRVCTEGPIVRITKHMGHIPDVTVECTRLGSSPSTEIMPSVIVEVLSPSTKFYDQTTKLQNYLSLLYLNDILLINQDEHAIEHYFVNKGVWDKQFHYLDDNKPHKVIELATANLTINTAELFA